MDAKLRNQEDSFSAREQFLEEQQNCPLCGSEMILTHVTHFLEKRVMEQAECEACRILVRSQNHLLQ